MFKIGEFSKLSRISIRMLRHYDEIGLLVPEETDPWTGYRRYAAAQLMTANRITALRGLGFSLAETAALLACWEDRTAMETRLLAQRAGLEFAAVLNGTTPASAFDVWPHVFLARDLDALARFLEERTRPAV